MTFSKVPTDWITSWAEDGTTITVPIASFPQLTAAEADAATGDIRSIVHAVVEKLWNEWNERPAADRPTKMTISKSASVNVATGVTTSQYTFRIMTVSTGEDVEDEPA